MESDPDTATGTTARSATAVCSGTADTADAAGRRLTVLKFGINQSMNCQIPSSITNYRGARIEFPAPLAILLGYVFSVCVVVDFGFVGFLAGIFLDLIDNHIVGGVT